MEVGVDAVHELGPGPALEVAAGFGGEDFADDFGLGALAVEQEVEGGGVVEAGVGEVEAAGALQAGGADEVEEGDEVAGALHGLGQHGVQAAAAGLGEGVGEGDEFGGQAGDALVERGDGGVAAGAAQALDGEFEGVELAEGAAGVGGHAAAFQFRHPGLPRLATDAVDQGGEDFGDLGGVQVVHARSTMGRGDTRIIRTCP